MSTLKVYTIRDKKMGNHLRPMYVPHLVEVQRNLLKVLKEKNSTIAEYPSDYELYHLADWDEQTATYTLKKMPEFILNIQDLIEEPTK